MNKNLCATELLFMGSWGMSMTAQAGLGPSWQSDRAKIDSMPSYILFKSL